MQTSTDLCVFVSETIGSDALFHHVVIQPLTFLKDDSGTQFDYVSIRIFAAVTHCRRSQLPRVHIGRTTKRLLFQGKL